MGEEDSNRVCNNNDYIEEEGEEEGKGEDNNNDDNETAKDNEEMLRRQLSHFNLAISHQLWYQRNGRLAMVK